MSLANIPGPSPRQPAAFRPHHVELLWKAKEALRADDHFRLAAVFKALEDGGLFFDPAKWAELTACARESACGKCLPTLWEQFARVLPKGFFADAFIAFCLASVVTNDAKLFRSILELLANRSEKEHFGAVWRRIIEAVLNSNSASLAAALCANIERCGGFLIFRDVESFTRWLAEEGEIEGLAGALAHVNGGLEGRFFLQNWQLIFATVLAALRRASTNWSACIRVLFQRSAEVGYRPAPPHWFDATALMLRDARPTEVVCFLERAELRRTDDWSYLFGLFAKQEPLDAQALVSLLDLAERKGVGLRPLDYQNLVGKEIERCSFAAVPVLLKQMSARGFFVTPRAFGTLVAKATSVPASEGVGDCLTQLFSDVEVQGRIDKEDFQAAFRFCLARRFAQAIVAVGQRMNAQGTFLTAQEWSQLALLANQPEFFNPGVARALWDVVSEESREFLRGDSQAAFLALAASCPEEQGVWPGLAAGAQNSDRSSDSARFPAGKNPSELQHEASQAVIAGDVAGLRRVFDELEAGEAYFPLPVWGSLLSAATTATKKLSCPGLARCLWDGSIRSREHFNAGPFGLLAGIASASGEAELVGELFDAWEPSATTLEEQEHATWSQFLKAASQCNDDTLVLRIVERLYWLFDPTRFESTGTLRPQLHQIRIRIQDDAIRRAVEQRLYGLHWRSDDFFRVLRAWPPRQVRGHATRFDGACRCLKKFWINSWFAKTSSEFSSITAEIVEGLDSLPRFRLEAWAGFLAQAWDNLPGNLLSRHRALYRQVFGSLIDMQDLEAFASLIEQGTVAARLAEYIESLARRPVIPQTDTTTLSPDSPTCVMAPITTRILQWLEDKQERRYPDRRLFRQDIEHLCLEFAPHELSRTDAVLYLHHLLLAAADATQTWIARYAITQIHEGKRNFQKDFQEPLENPTLNHEERLLLASFARTRLSNGELMLGSRRLGDPIAINLSRIVEKWLVKPLRDDGFDPQGTRAANLMVFGMHGAKATLLEPMMKEILRNAVRYLKQTPVAERYVTVDLVSDLTEVGWQARLSVINSVPPEPTADPIGNQRGLEALKQWAGLFRGIGEKNEGIVATYVGPPKVPVGHFRLDVLLPLWTDASPSISDDQADELKTEEEED